MISTLQVQTVVASVDTYAATYRPGLVTSEVCVCVDSLGILRALR